MFDPISLGVTALGLGAGLGGSLFGKKKKEEPEFNYYASPDYQQLKDLLYKRESQGYFNEMKPSYMQMWNEDLMPQIREEYEARRGFQPFSSTPEYAEFSRQQRGLLSQMGLADIGARQNILSLLAGITSRPVTSYQEPEPSFFENVAGIGAPLLNSYLQYKTLSPLLRNDDSPIGKIAPQDIGNIYQSKYPYLMGSGIDNLFYGGY